MSTLYDEDPEASAPDLHDAPTVPLRSAYSRSRVSVAPSRPPRRGVSRRAVVLGAAGAAVGVGAVGAATGYALTHLDNPLLSSLRHLTSIAEDAHKVTHLLRRAGFGASPAELGDYLHLGVSGATERLLNYASVTNDVDARLAAFNFTFDTRINLQRWWLARMLLTKRPLEEKMTLFWHGVLTSSFSRIGKPYQLPLMIDQNSLIRTHAMGRFDDLVRGVSTSPAMLYWLDGHSSTGTKPNENYSRELMELFTLGIGHYTQDDVTAGAKALSGWVVRNGQGVFEPHRFYQGTVTYLGHTGHLGLDDIVKIVCAHPATPQRIARLLWSFFVFEEPSQSDVQPLVDAYQKSDHQISAMVRAMLTSPAFFSDKAYRARVKSPVEFTVGAVRATGLTPTAPLLTMMAQQLTTMGQTVFDPPNVAGWPGDKVSAAWLSTQTWITRVNFINQLMGVATGEQGNHLGGATSASASPLQAIITAQHIAKPEDLVNSFVSLLLDNHLASDRRAIVLDALTSAATAGAGATFTLSGGATLPAAAVRQALYLLMSMPEYQMN